MGTHNVCLYKEVDIKYTGCNLKTAKLSQTVWELWPAQDFGFREDNYIMKTLRVVSLARDMPTGPPLHSH